MILELLIFYGREVTYWGIIYGLGERGVFWWRFPDICEISQDALIIFSNSCIFSYLTCIFAIKANNTMLLQLS
jgi:hypothetical protein